MFDSITDKVEKTRASATQVGLISLLIEAMISLQSVTLDLTLSFPPNVPIVKLYQTSSPAGVVPCEKLGVYSMIANIGIQHHGGVMPSSGKARTVITRVAGFTIDSTG